MPEKPSRPCFWRFQRLRGATVGFRPLCGPTSPVAGVQPTSPPSLHSRGKLWTPGLSQDGRITSRPSRRVTLRYGVRGAPNRPYCWHAAPWLQAPQPFQTGVRDALDWPAQTVPGPPAQHFPISRRRQRQQTGCLPGQCLRRSGCGHSRVPNTATGCVHMEHPRRRVAMCSPSCSTQYGCRRWVRCKIVESLGTKAGAKASNATLHASNSQLGQAHPQTQPLERGLSIPWAWHAFFLGSALLPVRYCVCVPSSPRFAIPFSSSSAAISPSLKSGFWFAPAGPRSAADAAP